MASVKFKGKSSSQSYEMAMRKALSEFRQPLAAAIYQEGEGLMTEAKVETPVRFGHLRASGHVTQPINEGDRVTVQVGFGGPSAPYAVIVHENLEAYHEPPTKAKFLEDPYNRRQPGMVDRVVQRVRDYFK